MTRSADPRWLHPHLREVLEGLARRIPRMHALQPRYESRPPQLDGVGEALALGDPLAAPRPAFDPQGLLDALDDPGTSAEQDDAAPAALPPMGLHARYGEANPVAWTGADAVPADLAALPTVLRSRADARWLRVADADCVGLLEGDIRVDVDDAGVEWLFLPPGPCAALRLRGGWVLVAEHGMATLCREEAAPVRVPAPDWAALDALATLDPHLVAEAEGTVDHVGLYVRYATDHGDIVARVLSGAAPPHLDAVRAWVGTIPSATWEDVRREADARAQALHQALPGAVDVPGVARAAVTRDVLESGRIVLSLAGHCEGLDTLLGRIDDAADAAGLAEVDLDPVPVRLQHEARALARWWGRA
ncbi:MAG: hypothetical protein Q8P41_28555 [Pseudomonadota bacterium]|nr:hypothetical protein [Pseudomonadota bacterium]